MKGRELIRKLKRLGATVDTKRGKGGHVRVELNGNVTVIPTGSKEIPTGTFHAICRQLGVDPSEL